MDAFLIDVIEPLFLSAWVFPITVLFVALDGVVPLVPGEGVVITGTVLAEGNAAKIGALVLAAAAGSLLGDSASYGIGRFFGTRVSDRLLRSGKRAAAHQWAKEKLDRNGGSVLIAARFVPGGRTATTLCAGTLRFPFRRFLPYASIASVAWASYTTALGVVAGGAFVDRPLQSVVLGIGLGIGLSMFFELIRRVGKTALAARRRRAERADGDSMNPTGSEGSAGIEHSQSGSQGATNTADAGPASRPILLESSQQDQTEAE